jgi:hypothetical protein
MPPSEPHHPLREPRKYEVPFPTLLINKPSLETLHKFPHTGGEKFRNVCEFYIYVVFP